MVWRNPRTITHRPQPYPTASQPIFEEENAAGKLPSDTIDLHGQYVGEAEKLLRRHIRLARSTNREHLCVIVGKGIHSRDNISRIKPRVEQVCRELGYHFSTERDEGCIFIDLKQEVMPTLPSGGATNGLTPASREPVFGNMPPPPGLYTAPKLEDGSATPGGR